MYSSYGKGPFAHLLIDDVNNGVWCSTFKTCAILENLFFLSLNEHHHMFWNNKHQLLLTWMKWDMILNKWSMNTYIQALVCTLINVICLCMDKCNLKGDVVKRWSDKIH